MIKALWGLSKIAILIASIVWIAQQPGNVTIHWLNYTYTLQLGFFLVILLGISVLAILVFSIIKLFLDLPRDIQTLQNRWHKKRGYRALTLGLTAIAAGNAANAAKEANRARHFLKEEQPLTLLLEAQSARLNGKEQEAEKIFTRLLEHKDAAFLGVRGLLQIALDHGDYPAALEMGRKALKLQPKQHWIQRTLYDLEIRLQNWNAARKILDQAEKTGAITAEKSRSDRVSMLLAEADEAHKSNLEHQESRLLKKAYKYDPSFVPTVSRLGQFYLRHNKRRSAVNIVEKTWKSNPHPELAALWEQIGPPARSLKKEGSRSVARIKWYERLTELNPNNAEGLVIHAEILIEEGLWGEARKRLEKAEKLSPTPRLYKLWAQMEEKATQNHAGVKKLLEKSLQVPPGPAWVCTETGRIYNEWTPVSQQGLFNTIRWEKPSEEIIHPNIPFLWSQRNNFLFHK